LGRKINAQLGRIAPRDREVVSRTGAVIASEAKQSILSLRGEMDCFAEPVIGRAFERRKKRSGQGMHTMKLWRIGVIMAWLVLLAVPGAGSAQENFPSRPVRIVIPYSAGSVADVFARIVAQNMAVLWNASIIVESKSGAGITAD
jgi:hypothetical protein